MSKNKIHNGILFDVYQREQEQFDGSIKTFEMIDRINTSMVLATQGNNILITYQTQPGKDRRYHAFLGGMVPRGASETTQAKEELLEESGMISDDRELYDIHRAGSAIDRETHIFIARNCTKITEQHLDPGGEKIIIESISFSELIDMISTGQIGWHQLRANILQMKIDNTLHLLEQKLFPNRGKK